MVRARMAFVTCAQPHLRQPRRLWRTAFSWHKQRAMKHEQKPQNQNQPQTTPKVPGVLTPQSPLAGHSYATGQALQTMRQQPGQAELDLPAVSSLTHAASELHAQHGQALAQGALRAKVPEAGLAAIVLAETHLLPAKLDERLPVRFEPYPFWLATGKWLVDSHKDQGAEYRALAEAQQIDPQAAWQATRMGVGQVSGTEAKSAGYASAEAMHAALTADPAAQIRALAEVVAASAPLTDALAAEDWRTVAALRAGPAAGALGYEDALAAFASSYKPFAAGSQAGVGGGDDDKPKRRKR